MKICMLSSVHSANDIRIVEKEARSLSEADHDVTVVARPPRPSDPGRIAFKLIEIPPMARWKRPWVAGSAAIALALAATADVVQFHDPKLIPFALRLKRRGCKVIYDIHEACRWISIPCGGFGLGCGRLWHARWNWWSETPRGILMRSWRLLMFSIGGGELASCLCMSRAGSLINA